MDLIGKIRSVYKLFVLGDPYLREVLRWKRANGDKVLRLDYPLGVDSIVWDLGGYHGDFAHDIISRFGCHVVVFEPVQEFVDVIESRFSQNSRVRVFPYGLSSKDGNFELCQLDEGSSFYNRSSARMVTCQTRNIATVLQEIPGDIDLLKINIEGGEFDILPLLIENGIERFRFLQIQFHNFVPNAPQLRENIHAGLARTHRQMWCYPFVWESWVRRD